MKEKKIQFADWLIELANRGFGLSTDAFLKSVKKFLDKEIRTIPFNSRSRSRPYPRSIYIFGIAMETKAKKIILSFVILRTESGLNRLWGQILEFLWQRKENCERFEPRSHFKRLSLIVRVNVVLNRTGVVDSDCIHANPPGLSGSLPDTTPISRSPVRVALSPELNHLLSFSVP